MSAYSNQLAWAAKTAQKILAPMCDPEETGEFTLDQFPGDTFTGVLNEQNEMDPADATGIRRIRTLYIYAIKSQFDSAPTAAPRREGTAKGARWTVSTVTHEPQHYRLVLRAA